MACGAAVISSHSSSLPEVVGEAGLLIEPTDTAALSQALQRVLNEPDLRRTLSQKGQAQAHKFSWQKAADELERVYKALL